MNLSEIKTKANEAIEAIRDDTSFGKANIDARQTQAFELISALADYISGTPTVTTIPNEPAPAPQA